MQTADHAFLPLNEPSDPDQTFLNTLVVQFTACTLLWINCWSQQTMSFVPYGGTTTPAAPTHPPRWLQRSALPPCPSLNGARLRR